MLLGIIGTIYGTRILTLIHKLQMRNATSSQSLQGVFRCMFKEMYLSDVPDNNTQLEKRVVGL